MKSKKKKSIYAYSPLLVLTLLLIVIVCLVLSWKKRSNIVKDQVASQNSQVVQNIEIEGLVNKDDVISSGFDLQLLKHPLFSVVNAGAKIEGYDTQENFSFNELDKKPFYCLPEGEIRNDSVTFYMGSSRYRDENTKLIFKSDYLLKNIELPGSTNTQDETINYCWRETSSEITLNEPDFGIISWAEVNNKKAQNQVVFFYGDKKLQISSGYFKNIVPLYLSTDKFLAVFEASGGGWNDTEVLSFDLKNMTFQNEDNCASLFPRNSVTLQFDKKCYWGIEGNPTGSVSDFGFERN